MNISIELNSNELNMDLLLKIKELFKNKSIRLFISEENETSEYLLNNRANYEHLLNSLNETETINFTAESFVSYSKALLEK